MTSIALFRAHFLKRRVLLLRKGPAEDDSKPKAIGTGFKKKKKEKKGEKKPVENEATQKKIETQLEIWGKLLNPLKKRIPRTQEQLEEGEKIRKMWSKMCLIRDKYWTGYHQHRLRQRKLAIEEIPEHLREHALTPDLSPFPEEMIIPQIDPPPEDVDIFGRFQRVSLVDWREGDPLETFGSTISLPGTKKREEDFKNSKIRSKGNFYAGLKLKKKKYLYGEKVKRPTPYFT
eukprot:TRINITY_DN2451_c0_g1_i1.p1 TRINITY_DN2451_c0_g1~~TRINITY_DN2451_c0_g1_i1.p1  ORF type:complete len:232 (-),score=51.28 TRINITY_DN2451_c0_g1_i1:14-709(-)